MSSADSWWLSFWEWFASVGFLLVIVGCIIEGVEHLVKFKRSEAHKRKGIEKLGWLILVVGLAMEFLGDRRAKRIADRENRRLSAVAAFANERAALVESNNLVLQKQLAEIKQWRTIKPEQKKAFIDLTKGIEPKFPIRVRYAPGSTEVASFAYQIRSMLDAGGFAETNGDLSICPWPPELNLLWTGGLPMPSVTFLNNISTTGNVVDLRDAWASYKSLIPSASTNSSIPTMFILTNTDEPQKAFVSIENGTPMVVVPAPSAGGFRLLSFTQVQNAFNGIGIGAGSMPRYADYKPIAATTPKSDPIGLPATVTANMF